MKTKNLLVVAVACVVLFPAFVFARPKPDLYPNAYYKKVGETQAQRDVIDCQVQAEDHLGGNGAASRGAGAKTAVKGAAKGAALGALAGSITKSGAGRGAGAGAAVGGLSSGLGARRERQDAEVNGSPELRKYMEACLEEKGYRVVGWK